MSYWPNGTNARQLLLERARKNAAALKRANYRPAEDPKRSCGTCGAFDARTGMCSMFDEKVEADHTCDDWVTRVNKVSSLALAQLAKLRRRVLG